MTKKADIEIYTTKNCGYCKMAKDFLNRKDLAYQEIDVSDPEDRATMVERAEGRRTVPQIFIKGKGIGGYEDLYKLDQSGKLDDLL